MPDPTGFRLASDIGGTFTDTVLMDQHADVVATAKTPTTPSAPALGALEGTTRVLEAAGLGWGAVSGKIHGTTLATNALIERRGARVATLTTEGFRDILEIAYERRYSQYAINLVKPDLIVPRARAFTIGGRMDARGAEIRPLCEAQVAPLAAELRAAGVEALAICLLHAYANPAHELRLRDLLARACPEIVVSLSHEVSPEAREFDRLCTTIANAYIQPLMASYLTDFRTRFTAAGLACPILMMTAGGGMCTLETAAQLPIRLVESGPAGGAILAARIAQETQAAQVLSFDMGGTTAKLCLIDGFRPQTARRFEISRAERFVKGSGMPVRIPVIEMIEIGAGGGSIASVDRLGRLRVGPESAGSDPGPAGFGKGGTAATVTDADIAMGLIDPARFAEGRLRIDAKATAEALERALGSGLGGAIDAGQGAGQGPDPELSATEAGFAISEIVDETMASAGRMHAVESGKDLDTRVMIAFGGNGPLHATRVARRARVRSIVIPRDPGVGSAVGFLHAPVSFEIIRSRHGTLAGLDLEGTNALLATMAAEAREVVRAGAPTGPLTERRVAFMRYHGQGHEIDVALPAHPLRAQDLPDLQTAFEQAYARQFSRVVPGMEIEILNWGVSVASEAPATAPAAGPSSQAPRSAQSTAQSTSQSSDQSTPQPTTLREIICDVTGAPRQAQVFLRADLRPGDRLEGPALIIEPQTTTLVSADFSASVDGAGNIWMSRKEEGAT